LKPKKTKQETCLDLEDRRNKHILKVLYRRYDIDEYVELDGGDMVLWMIGSMVSFVW